MSLRQIRPLHGAIRIWTSISQDEMILPQTIAALQIVCLTNTLSVYTLSFENNKQQDEEYNLQRMEYKNWYEIQMGG